MTSPDPLRARARSLGHRDMSLVCRGSTTANSDEVRATNEKVNPGVTKGRRRALDPLVLSGWKTRFIHTKASE